MLRAEGPTNRTPARTARETWFDHGLLALVLALSLVGFRRIIEGNDWWVTTLLVAGLVGLTCGVLRAVGTRWVAPVAVVVELVVLAWVFVPETLVSIVPTAATFRGLFDLVSQAQTIIVEEQAPVGAAKPVVLVMAGSFGLIVVVGDFLLQRRRAAPLVGVLLLAVFLTPAVVAGETPSVWLFLAMATVWLVLLRSRSTSGPVARTGSAPAFVLGSAALAAAVAFPLVTPDISAVASNWGKPPPSVFGRGINPILELGQNLRRNSTQTSLTYTTTLNTPPYLKVATLTDFTGKTWKPISDLRVGGRSEGELDIDDSIDVSLAATTITIKQLRSSMLPVPYPAVTGTTGLKGSWQWRPIGMTLTSREDDSRGQKYTVTSLDRKPTAEQMRSVDTFVGTALAPYTELPRKLPAIITDTAEQVTQDADNDYDRVRALQSYLRDGDFRYSETAPVADGYDGNGVDVIAEFLKEKAGYCVHFSSAMAVMARSLGIPARIAVGYAPGDPTGVVNGQTVYESTTDDLHAWVEIYFQGVGWVQFDPTTGIGSATGFQEPDTADAPDSPDAAAPAPVPSARPDVVEAPDTEVAATAETTNTAPRTALATLAGLVLVGAVPWLLRQARRRWRLTKGRGAVDPLWRELEDSARDLGLPVSATDTPRGFAGRLRGRPGVDADALESLLRRVETSRFARDTDVPGDGVADLAAVVASLRAGASTRGRLRATLLPRSLSGRSVAVPDGNEASLAT